MADQSTGVSSSLHSKARVLICTGPVGSGKSLLINCLLQQRPLEERWAVLVNDIGKTDVEASSNHVEVRVVPGACTSGLHTGLPIRTALVQMLKMRPHTLFIELSTLGAPSGFQGMIESMFSNVAFVQNVIAVVPQNLHFEVLRSNNTYEAQLKQSSMLVVHQGNDAPGETEAGVGLSELQKSLAEFNKPVMFWQPQNLSTSSLEEVIRTLLQSD